MRFQGHLQRDLVFGWDATPEQSLPPASYNLAVEMPLV
jgi:hypothetical protein